MADDVQLTDLEVIQRYSLAVRGATASREDLVRALESDLAWLTGRELVGPDERSWDEAAPRPTPSPSVAAPRPKPSSSALPGEAKSDTARR